MIAQQTRGDGLCLSSSVDHSMCSRTSEHVDCFLVPWARHFLGAAAGIVCSLVSSLYLQDNHTMTNAANNGELLAAFRQKATFMKSWKPSSTPSVSRSSSGFLNLPDITSMHHQFLTVFLSCSSSSLSLEPRSFGALRMAQASRIWGCSDSNAKLVDGRRKGQIHCLEGKSWNRQRHSHEELHPRKRTTSARLRIQFQCRPSQQQQRCFCSRNYDST